jgi:hypothetical protein
MRRRLPLLRTVVLLTAALAVVSVALLGFVRVPRVVVAPGRLVGEGGRFEGVVVGADRSLLHPGRRAAIRLEAYPWMQKGTLAGRVAGVSEAPGEGGGHAVTIAVDPGTAPGPLAGGLRGEARIETGETESLGRLLVSRLGGAPR